MAHAKSAKKRVRQNVVVTERNRHYKTMIRKKSRNILNAVANKKTKQAKTELHAAVGLIQKVAGKGIIHRNKAANMISRLTKRVAKLS